ncbi:5'-deoxynucleotidase HDDC2 isoform X5 [Hemicordylus capensis]|uniref:5'-deoxynucleotidase HDDC2 isoform X5 n=1 Tax=Hemicordylus capensis TaxID=884348 RepID=UPI002303FE7C|nr:5'-deoxynucleotidase HDDC2 isoform X5 [Hemicordylus capensis]
MGTLLQFMKLVGQLKVSRREPGAMKRVPRTGWVYRKVANPESVSDHMYRMAVMAMVTEDKTLNKDRCIRLALIHDMAECIVGDIAPADNISKEEKHRREEEYEYQSSAEARFVKELDQCEMILQALEYEELEGKPGRLQDFYDSTADFLNLCGSSHVDDCQNEVDSVNQPLEPISTTFKNEF